MNTNNDFTPLLRFLEYRTADSIWEKQKIGDIVKTIVPPKKLQSNEFKKTGKYPIVDQSQKYICGYSDDNLAVINGDANDLIIFGDHTCILKFIDFPFIQGADGIKIMVSSNPDKISTRYLFQFLKAFPIESNEYKRHFSELKEKTVFYPKLIEEQYKIADCFFSIDSCLSSINEKKEQLKAHKKSLMQKLFPQNGQTVPEYRFPEFEKDGMWNFVNGSELFEPIVNKNHHSDLPILAITQDQGAVPREMIDYNVIVSKKSIANYKVVEIGDFIISLRSFQGGVEYSNHKGLCSPAYIVLRKKNDTIYNDFYRHYFKSIQFIRDLNRNLEGIRDGKMVSYQQFSQILIPYPPYEEQHMISNCISSMDKTIKVYSEKVYMMEQYKRGLMEQLFPRL